MMQQVNLYKDTLQQGQKKHTLLLLSAIAGLIGLGVIAFSIMMTLQVNKLETLVTRQRQALQAEQTQLNKMLALQPASEINATLAQEVSDWQNSSQELTQALQLMASPTIEASPGFSRYLLALAKQSIPTLWLTNIVIIGPQQAINLEGSTFKPKHIPDFLQRLQRESVFAGKTFAKLMLSPSEKIPAQTDFKLQALLDTPENGHVPNVPKMKVLPNINRSQVNHKDVK